MQILVVFGFTTTDHFHYQETKLLVWGSMKLIKLWNYSIAYQKPSLMSPINIFCLNNSMKSKDIQRQ